MNDTTTNTVDVTDTSNTDSALLDLTQENTAEAFVSELYSNYLYREADEAGLTYWAGEIENGTLSEAEVSQSFLQSEEYSGNVEPIMRLYYSLLKRAPDEDGLKHWVHEHRSGSSLEDIADSFLQAEETQMIYNTDMDDEAFIASLYQNLLNRAEVNESEITNWTEQLANGMSRSDLVIQFSESDENIVNTADEIETNVIHHGNSKHQQTQNELTIGEYAQSAAEQVEILFQEAGMEDINISVHVPSGLDGKSPKRLNDKLPSGWFKFSTQDNQETDDNQTLPEITDDATADITVTGVSDVTTSAESLILI